MTMTVAMAITMAITVTMTTMRAMAHEHVHDQEVDFGDRQSHGNFCKVIGFLQIFQKILVHKTKSKGQKGLPKVPPDF